MPDLPTRTELFEIAAREIQTRGADRAPSNRIDPAQVFVDGSDINLVVAGTSAMAEEVLRQLAIAVANLYLDSAEGEDLDRLVSDRFSPTVVRRDATPAIGEVTFTRTAGQGALTVPVGTRLASTFGLEYELTSSATFGAGATGPASATAKAVEAGTTGNAPANTITQVRTPPPSLAEGLTVTNAEPFAGGDGRETDASLRARAREFYLVARRGTLAAIEFGALTVAGVRLATATEEVDELGDPTGRVSLFIADANGQANATLATAVENALFEWRAAGIVVDVIAASPVFEAITLRLDFEAGTDSKLAFERVRAALVARVNLLAPGVTLQRSLIFEVCRSVPGVVVNDDAIVEPVGDVVPDGGQVIRTASFLVNPEGEA